ncbi:MAG: glucoamylase family protein, partial [Candidatus Eisenbacteria bacterium]
MALSASRAIVALAAVIAICGCDRTADRLPTDRPPSPRETAGETEFALSENERAFLDTLEERTFRWFWEQSDPETGLTPDRTPTRSFMSTAAVGFALTAYPIGAERGYVSREEAAERARRTLRFFLGAPQDSSVSGSAGFRGFFYHFLDAETGCRFGDVELSTMDTALLLAGALFCMSYFDRDTPAEHEIRASAESLYARADWRWAEVRPPTIVHGWKPESGFLPYDWRGYNEAMLVYILALGSPSHPVGRDAWDAWVSGYRWGAFHEEEHLGFAPLFGHQYTHVWIDLRGIRDGFMRGRGVDYFENSRRAARAQRAYATLNPGGWAGYGPLCWG